MTKFQQGCGYLRQDINLVRALRDEPRLRAYWTKVAFACDNIPRQGVPIGVRQG